MYLHIPYNYIFTQAGYLPLSINPDMIMVMVMTVVMANPPHKAPGFPSPEYTILQELPWDVPRLSHPTGPPLECYQAAPPPLCTLALALQRHDPVCQTFSKGIAEQMKPSSFNFVETDSLGKSLTCRLLSFLFRNPWINHSAFFYGNP